MNSDSHPVDENKNRNREHVDRIIAKINGMFDLTEDRQNVTYGMEILKDMLSLDTDYRDDNDEVLQPWHLYLSVLEVRVRMSIDTTVRNDEVEAYTDFICTNRDKLLEVFTFPRFQKVIMLMITDNLSLHDLEGIDRIMKEYGALVSYYYRPIMYSRILRANCGRLDLEKEIYTLYDRFHINIVYYQDKPTEPVLLKNLFRLSKELGIEEKAKPVYDFIDTRHRLYLGKTDLRTVELYDSFVDYVFCMDKVNDWIRSCEGVDVPEDAKETFEKLKEKIEVGNMPTTIMTFTPVGDLFDDLFQQCAFRAADRNYSKSALYSEVVSAMEYYAKCSHDADPEDSDRLFKTNSYYYGLKNLERSLKFWSKFEKAVTLQNCTSDSDKVFFFINEWSLVNASLALPIIISAQKHGYTYVPTSARMSVHTTYDEPFLEEIGGILSGDIDRRSAITPFTKDSYEIDIPNKKIIVQGMNVYQPIYEFVARYQFSYFLNYETDAWARMRTNLLIKAFDRLFTYIKGIEEWADKNNKTVYFVSHAPHIHNAAAFRIYCEERNEKGNLNYICVSGGYDNYFKNIGDARTETITALNLTKNPYSRNSFLGTKEGFDRYYESNRSNMDEIRAKAINYLTVHRGVGKKNIDKGEKKRIIKLIKNHKSKGNKVVLLNGKVIFDLAVKYTKGCVHEDMSEWITHAVDFAKKNKDILLLIKPHPHEKREDLTLTSNKVHTLRSIIKTKLGENTIFLDHDMFTNSELTPFVDVGLVWNGTSSLEFAAQGIHVLVGDVWGHYDYPIGFAWPESIEEYESWLKDPSLIKEPEDLADKAIMFLDYMGSDDVRIENRYSKTTTLNFNQFDSQIDLNEVYRYFEAGDEKLDKLFESVL